MIIFDRLNDLGNDFTFYINGLSNKQRYAWPEVLPQGKVEDYFNLRVKRRTFVVRIGRTGDEFYLDRKPFSIRSTGMAGRIASASRAARGSGLCTLFPQ